MNTGRQDFHDQQVGYVKKLSPVDELGQILDRLDERIRKVRECYRRSLLPELLPRTTTPIRGLHAMLFARKLMKASQANKGSEAKAKAPSEPESPRLTPERIRNVIKHKNSEEPIADFIPFLDEMESDEGQVIQGFIEDLRRVAEMCIIGENFVANIEKKKEAAFKRQQENWAKARDNILLGDGDDSERGTSIEDEGHGKLELFDLFFERNGLEMIVNLLTGKTFQFNDVEKAQIRGEKYNYDSDEGQNEKTTIYPSTPVRNTLSPVDSIPNDDTPTPTYSSDHPSNKIVLPPFSVAIQALQSISILIQNVSRATSLYVILSNNHVNELIGLPLNLYNIAEQRRQVRAEEHKQMPSAYSNQVITEMSTHFVTFLKSLAMRMNAQTLQFFLKYPVELGAGRWGHKKRSKGKLRRTRSLQDSIFDDKPLRGVPRTPERFAIVGKSRMRSKSNEYTEMSLLKPEPPLSSELDIDHKATRGNQFDQDDSSLDNNLSESHCLSPDLQQSKASEINRAEKEIHLACVEFPLYERALELCGAHHDSFVRLTAMNICLNTLRLATVTSDNDLIDVELHNNNESPEKIKSPDGVLHNASALPFRERLAIAQFTCTPSRVLRLISPIFEKLATRWNAIDEHIRIIDTNKHMGLANANIESSDLDLSIKSRLRNGRRMITSLQDKIADMQDELFMLEDVFKVGLSVLNEQTIEMMLATFVYPLLLQPLLNYANELTASVDETRFSFTDHPFGWLGADLSDISKTLVTVSGPAKAALFTIGCVFQSLSNPPLLRLILTVLLHPLSPDSTSAPTVRSKLEVAVIDNDGRTHIRLDGNNSKGGSIVPNGRTTYPFGTATYTRLSPTADAKEVDDNDETCIFVLAPALAELLEFDGQESSLYARCQLNPYRRALIKCLSVPDDMSDIRDLTVCTLDAAFILFDSDFLAEIIYGKDFKNIDLKTPPGESNPEMGVSTTTFEITDALIRSVVTAKRVSSSDWELRYDCVASHALLCAIRRDPVAIGVAYKLMEQRINQSGKILSDMPTSGLTPMGGSAVQIPGSPSVNDPIFEESIFNYFINYVFYEQNGETGKSIAESLVVQQQNKAINVDYLTTISTESCTDSLMSRVGSFLLEGLEPNKIASEFFEPSVYKERRNGAMAFIRLTSLFSLLQHMAKEDEKMLFDCSLSAVIISADRSVVNVPGNTVAKDMIASLLPKISSLLFAVGSNDASLPRPLATFGLSSFEMLPCVCEAPASAAHLFAEDVSGVEAEGVTWQSLYIVFMDQFLVFAQPEPGQSGGMGRVISTCGLANVSIQRDTMNIHHGGPARRLILSHIWYTDSPPSLFVHDSFPEDIHDLSPVLHVQGFTSRLDVWFEHHRAADHAYKAITTRIFESKVERGLQIKGFLQCPNY